MKQSMKLGLGAMALGVCVAAQAAAPIITSFSENGVLVCSNLVPGSVASLEWASAIPNGPWSNWPGMEAVVADANGMIQVNVPMWFRVRGTNSAPAGMALIPGGAYTMGDTLDGLGGAAPISVTVSAFYMDTNEVSYRQWTNVYAYATNHGYSFSPYAAGGGEAWNHPVQYVNWYDCVKWSNARSEQEGLTPAYYTEVAQTNVYRTGELDIQSDWVKWNTGYRLPTEAEWEKAARGGVSGHRFPWSDVDTISHSQANYYVWTEDGTNKYAYDVSPTQGYHPTYGPHTSPVGSFAPNGYGLYDMAGNVAERCWDWYQDNWYSQPGATQNDTRGPTGPLSYRVVRGGNWCYMASEVRCAARLTDDIIEDGYSGFRCVRGL